MAVLSHSKFMLLLLLIAAALLRGSHGQDSSSRSSRRETSDGEETEFVGNDNRGQAGRDICYKTSQRIFEDYLEGDERLTPVWPKSPPEFHAKPVISKSLGNSTFFFF